MAAALTEAQGEALRILREKGTLHTTGGAESSDTGEGVRASTLRALEGKGLVRGTSRGTIYTRVRWKITVAGRAALKKFVARPAPKAATPAQLWKGLTKNMRTSLVAMLNPRSSQYAENYGGGLYMKATGWFVLDGNTTNSLRDRGLVEKALAARYDKADDTLYDNVTVARLTRLGRRVGLERGRKAPTKKRATTTKRAKKKNIRKRATVERKKRTPAEEQQILRAWQRGAGAI